MRWEWLGHLNLSKFNRADSGVKGVGFSISAYYKVFVRGIWGLLVCFDPNQQPLR